MYNVQFKFNEGHRVRITHGPHSGVEGSITELCKSSNTRSYEIVYRDPETKKVGWMYVGEDRLELVDQPVDLTQPAEVEAAKVGS